MKPELNISKSSVDGHLSINEKIPNTNFWKVLINVYENTSFGSAEETALKIKELLDK
jgi:hypothetical protein